MPANHRAKLLDNFRRAVGTLRVSARLVVEDLPILFLVSEVQSRAECPMRFLDCLSDGYSLAASVGSGCPAHIIPLQDKFLKNSDTILLSNC